MRIKIKKKLFAVPAAYLIAVGAIYVLGMLWFSDHWGTYIPAAIYLLLVGIIYVVLAVTPSGEKVPKTIYPITALIGIVCVALPHAQRVTDGATSFTTEYLSYLALICMGAYPFLRKENDSA